ncbi:MAG: hypothetical protein JWP89_6926 [Schlesneria sp.]|nr:hypothetical protein [Schlesneria sp.]
MREFFRGWRQKVGCVTMVVACFVLGLWMRSLRIRDVIDFPNGPGSCLRLVSENGRFSWDKDMSHLFAVPAFKKGDFAGWASWPANPDRPSEASSFP